MTTQNAMMIKQETKATKKIELNDLYNSQTGCLNLRMAVEPEALSELLGDRIQNGEIEEFHIDERFFGLGRTQVAKGCASDAISRILDASTQSRYLRKLNIRATSFQSISLPTVSSFPCSLQQLHITAGLSIDDPRTVESFAIAIQNQGTSLKSLRFQNFLVQKNCTRPVSGCSGKAANRSDAVNLLDPIVLAVSTLKHLQDLQLCCMVSHLPRSYPMVSPDALTKLVSSKSITLQSLHLTNLGLTDRHLHVLQGFLATALSTLEELVLNDNELTCSSIRDFLLATLGDELNRSLRMKIIRLHSNRRWSLESGQAFVDWFIPRHESRTGPSESLTSLDINLPRLLRSQLDHVLLWKHVEELMVPQYKGSDCLQALLIAQNQLDVLWDLLRTHPELCSRRRRSGLRKDKERRSARDPQIHELEHIRSEKSRIGDTITLISREDTKPGCHKSMSLKKQGGTIERTGSVPIPPLIEPCPLLTTPWQSRHKTADAATSSEATDQSQCDISPTCVGDLTLTSELTLEQVMSTIHKDFSSNLAVPTSGGGSSSDSDCAIRPKKPRRKRNSQQSAMKKPSRRHSDPQKKGEGKANSLQVDATRKHGSHCKKKQRDRLLRRLASSEDEVDSDDKEMTGRFSTSYTSKLRLT